MRLNRFFWNGSIEQKIQLNEEESNHLLKVLRLPTGSQIELYDGQGRLIKGTFIRVEKKRALVEVEEILKDEVSPVRLTMAIGLCRPPVMSLIIEKLSEIGVDRIITFTSKNCSERFSPDHFLRWQRISQQVLKITGRLFIPEISPPVEFEKLLELTNSYPEKILFDLKGSSKISSPLQFPVLGIVGPPGDFSLEEKESLLANNFKAVKINDAVLKTETAAIIGAGILKNA